MKSLRRLLVLLAGLALVGAIVLSLLVYRWISSEKSLLRTAPLTIVVSATYPGADARAVADTVAAPIEEQVNGVEKMLHMQSRCADDGTYSLSVTFPHGTDLDMAQVLVQNRVSLALPVLPDSVQNAGICVRKKSPAVLTILALGSPDDRFDESDLSNYATKQIRGEFARLPNVGDVVMLGRSDNSIQVWLDLDKLKRFELNLTEVLKELEEQNVKAGGAVGRSGNNKEFNLTIDPLAQLTNSEAVGNLVVKAFPNGATIFLRDIARIEIGVSGEEGAVRFDGRPVIGLAIHSLGSNVDETALNRDVKAKLLQLSKTLPDGLSLLSAFDVLADLPLLVDVELPSGASTERVQNVLDHCSTVIRATAGVTHTFATTDDPFAAPHFRPCILVALSNQNPPGGRGKIVADIRNDLHKEIPEAAVRVTDLASPGRTSQGGYPISFALCDISDVGHDALAALAGRIVRRLSENPKLNDVGSSPSLWSAPRMQIAIDRTKAQALGVTVKDIEKQLQTAMGSARVGPIQHEGRTDQIAVNAEGDRREIDALPLMRIASSTGQMIPLSTLVSIRDETAPKAIMRLDMYPMIEIGGNPAPGVSLAEARTICEKIAAEEIGAGFRMNWLSGKN